jgi:LysR family transcriptional regulator, transcription activator of glutamate synthase operon
MELRQLRSLVAIADEGTFTAAAARLHLAQPALSQQIARLEQEVGLTLLDRTTRRVSLTDAGTLLVERGRSVIAEIDAASAELASLRGVDIGVLALGVTPTTGPVDIAVLLGAYTRRYPGVELVVRDGLTRVQFEALRRDELDLALVTGEPPPDMEVIELASEPLVVTLPPKHPLVGTPSLTFEDLAAERIIGFSRGATIRAAVEQVAEAQGVSLDPAFEVDDVGRARALVSAGLGIGILPRTDAEVAGPSVAIADLAPTLTHRVLLAWRAARRLTPSARAFIALLRDSCDAPITDVHLPSLTHE